MRKELHEVHLIRALASTAVMVTHFSSAQQLALTSNFFPYGYLGVHLFFVLSGFIICYSLPDDYTIVKFKTFLIKRIVRIEPAYIASIFLVVGLNYISYYITGFSGNKVKPSDFIFHLAYLNNFGMGNYFNTNYWTLGIEFQYYLIIGILFPFIKNSNLKLFAFLMAIFALSFLNFNKGPTIDGGIQIIIPYFSIFGCGILVYFYKMKKAIDHSVFMVICLIFFIQIYLCFDIPTLVATILAIGILLFWKHDNGIIMFLSKISFSLYLIHFPIGMKVINLGLRFTHEGYQRYILFFLAIIVSLVAAYVFYLVIERPTFVLAKRIHYKSDSKLD